MSASASVSTPASVSLPDAGGRSLVTHTSGYPRIGAKRELKKAVEAYWQGKLPRAGLESMARDLRKTHWLASATRGFR